MGNPLVTMGKFILERESVTDEKCYKETDASADERQKGTEGSAKSL